MYRNRDLTAAQTDCDRMLHGTGSFQNRGTYGGTGTRPARHRFAAAALVYTHLQPILCDKAHHFHVHAVREDAFLRGC